jgi:UDP-galactopyranose mutase
MKIAILGGGPAGCAAAYFLRQKGVSDIIVYERAKRGGCAHTDFYENIPYEFGPQIMFTDKDYLRRIFEKFLPCYPPPNKDKHYKYMVSVDGTLGDCHDFPVTIGNIFKLKKFAKISYELCRAHLAKRDYSNFENYCISRIGKTLYETYIKNYNRKAWQMDPADMDTEWARFRPLTLQARSSRFKNQWQGHPGNYNPMWEAMTSDIEVKQAHVRLGGDVEYFVNGSPVEADLIVTTIPMSEKLEFINTCIVYVVLRSDATVMPCAFTTFPNTYTFTRIFEYRQEFRVESHYTVISFDFPWKNECRKDHYIEQALWFCKHMLKKEVVDHWLDNREKIYPVPTRKNSSYFRRLVEDIATRTIIPIGRAGMHAYISKDTCIRMGMETAEYLDELMDPGTKTKRLLDMRKDLH